MSKEVKVLNRKLRWHDGAGISYEADRKHAEAIIRESETGASNLTPLKVPMSKESKDGARDKSDDIGEETVGKIGHEGATLGQTDFEPCRNHSEESVGSNCQFSCH